MEGFDDAGVFFSEDMRDDKDKPLSQTRQAIKQKIKDFLRKFDDGECLKYRERLKRNYNIGQYYLEVNLEDLASMDENLADKFYKEPTEHHPLFEEAAKEVAGEITAPRPEGEEEVQDIQVIIQSDANVTSMRGLQSDYVSRLVKIPGIVIATSGIRAKATKMSIQCRGCQSVIPNLSVKPGLEGFILPRKCNQEQTGPTKCPLDPFFIVPDNCTCVNFQIIKLQELSESIPQGEVARHMKLYCEKYLCDKVVPGNRVVVTGIFCIKKVNIGSKEQRGEKQTVGVRAPYIRVLGISADSYDAGVSSSGPPITGEEEDSFRRLAAAPNVYERIAKSIAPSIFGAEDMKKAIACLLVGGSRKRMNDGLTRRGDINVLMLGDPGTAKSQLLKFAEKVAPIGVYTSGKGSSAAGLTASINRDPQNRNFVMEGGAMVLADGGVVCIDEFDKMKEDDRVAIHEAMEQQTISIAKAGITTTLNSRCSVLAAANSIYGRWDETKGEENIDFMPTILSRFDMIFIVKDEHSQQRDMTLAKHVMGVHMNARHTEVETADGEMSLNFIKKFIHYCRTTCGPRLSEAAGEKLRNRYVVMRNGTKEHEMETEKRMSIPITVRQLEAIVRISEALAKMQLQPFATESHIAEALRLFQVSTLNAAMSGSLAGVEGFTTQEDHETIVMIEQQLKKRFPIGCQVSEANVIADFAKQKYAERTIYKVIHTMIRRGELQYRLQRKMLYRVK
ncbi:DNA replication licensing factor Mcm5 [Cloeon dipterum]|uniref:DNA replication licensing factor Mcm5 n=1 Tax=Cloeon dipterum TaxID=197152 RepID=UPI00321F91EA